MLYVTRVASGGVRQASFAKTTMYVRNFLRACVHTQTQTLFELPLEKLLEAKILNENPT